MLVAPLDNVIVKVKTKYASNISSLLKRSAIQNGATVDPIDFVAITGEVVSAPMAITKRFDYEGYVTTNIQVGDTAIFSYSVVGDSKIVDDKVLFKNRLWYNGEEYFLCHIMCLYGVIRNGKIIMLNGFVMAETFSDSKIILPASSKKTKGLVHTKLMHIGHPKTNRKKIDAKSSDEVYFNPLKAQKYQINGKPFVILKQEQVFAKEV